jgi:hypothetical protein
MINFFGRIDRMDDSTVRSVSPQEIKELLERAAKEPGINDLLTLMKLSEEATQIEQIRTEMTPQAVVKHATGTAG